MLSSGEFLKSLQLVGGVIINNPMLAILENFLLEIENGKIKITASDGETTLQTIMNLIDYKEKKKIVVKAKLLIEVLKTFSEKTLLFKVKNNLLEIIDESDNYFIHLDDPNLYPSLIHLENTSRFKFCGNLLSKVISKTLFATGNDSIRPVMMGVLFSINEEGCDIVATDAHKLVKYTIKNITCKNSFEFIVPKKPLILLKNTLLDAEELVEVEFNEMNARFTYLNTTWICRLIDGKYPNYNAVIPKENPNILYVKTFLLSNAVKRASYFASTSNYQISFKLKNNILKIFSEDTNINNKANMQIPCRYSGEELTIAFNSKFLLEIINNINTENLVFKLSANNRPGIIKPLSNVNTNEDLLMLVMPVMIV